MPFPGQGGLEPSCACQRESCLRCPRGHRHGLPRRLQACGRRDHVHRL